MVSLAKGRRLVGSASTMAPRMTAAINRRCWLTSLVNHRFSGIDPAPERVYMRNMPLNATDTIPILIAPNPILKSKAKPVGKADDGAIRDLAARMLATMYVAPGIGLAAPQVGQLLRLITIDLLPDNKPAPITLINPEIVALADELATREEGCLSLPGQYAEVTRPARCKVRYLDLTGARREIEADGLLNACLQHEIDHLEGVLFVDHLSILKRNIIMRRLAKEQRQKRDDDKRR
jgi:peptide deformylase